MENDSSAQRSRAELLALIDEELGKLGIGMKSGHADLVSVPSEKILDFFRALVRSGLAVLHGTNADEPYVELEPRQANDASKESGNKKAVYATTDIFAALNHAVFNQRYAQQKLRSYMWGENDAGDGKSNPAKVRIAMSHELWELFKKHDPQIMRDGYVYVLDRSMLASAPDTDGSEFHSEERQVPAAICKVPKRLGEILFVVGEGDEDTIREYTIDELEEAAINKERFSKR